MYKSKLIKLANFEDMEVEVDRLGIPMTEEKIETMLNKIAKKNIIMDEVDKVEKGDILILDLSSHEEKFNKKNLPVTVGIGLFNLEIEKELLGMKKAQSRLLNLNGTDIKVEVKSIKRRRIPEVTDELIEKMNINGVNTLEKYKELLIKEDLKAQRMDILPQKSLEYVINNSTYIISEDDMEALYKEEIKELEAQANLEKTTSEEYVKDIYGITLEEFTAWIKENLTMTLKHMLIGMEYENKNNAYLTEEIYETELNTYAEENQIELYKAKEIISYKLYHTRWYPMKANEAIIGYWKNKL